MSYDANRHPGPGIEDFVAREHWRAIGKATAVQAGLLAAVAVLFAVPAAVALALTHLMALLAAVFGSLLATALAERGDRATAVQTARRAFASLILSGASLLLVHFVPLPG